MKGKKLLADSSRKNKVISWTEERGNTPSIKSYKWARIIRKPNIHHLSNAMGGRAARSVLQRTVQLSIVPFNVLFALIGSFLNL